MDDLDLNLLTALHALLEERSVTGAGRRLGLSTSAMSRTLTRLRSVTGDPILVPAGRAMVPTPHAKAIAGAVRAVTAAARAVLAPPQTLNIASLRRDFTIRANEAFVLLYAARLSAAVSAAAPGVRLRFAPKPDKDIQALRDGTVDLDIGVQVGDGAELIGQTLYRDAFIGVVRCGHPLLDTAPVTPEAYAVCRHVVASRHGKFDGPVDEALAALGLKREVAVVVSSFPAVIAVAAACDLVGLVPKRFSRPDDPRSVETFDLPVRTPEIVVSQLWHPRMDADPAHRWLRSLIHDAFRTAGEAI